MDNDVDVVEEYPLGLTAAFNGGCVEAEVLLEPVLDFVGDGDDLAIVGGRGDEEEVGESGVSWIEFENAGVFAFFVLAGLVSGLDEDASFKMM